MFLYLTKTLVVETLYYCNPLCYVKCSTSLLIFEATAMSFYHITHPHMQNYTHTHTPTPYTPHKHMHTHTLHPPTHMHAHTHPTHTQGSLPLQHTCSVTRRLNEVPTEALHVLDGVEPPAKGAHRSISYTLSKTKGPTSQSAYLTMSVTVVVGSSGMV